MPNDDKTFAKISNLRRKNKVHSLPYRLARYGRLG